MPPTTDSPARDSGRRLLDAADRLMYERGYEAVGVAELCAEADVKKGSFYYFYESKHALALAMLDRAWDRAQRVLFAPLADPDLGTIEAIGGYGERLAAMLRDRAGGDGEPIVGGCRFGNFAVELSTRDPEIRARVEEILDEMVELVAAAIRRGVASGELHADLDVDRAAGDVIAHMEGLMVMAKAHRDPDVLTRLGAVAPALLR